MENKFEWDFEEIYKDEKEFEADIELLEKQTEEIIKLKGTLSNNSNTVLDCYKKLEKALILEEKIYAYAMLKYHKDMSDVKSIKLFKRVEKAVTDFSEKISFISPEISKIDDETLRKFLEENEELRNEFKKSIEDIIKEKKHILTEEVERVLAKYSEVFGAPENAYDIFVDTELDFPDVVTKDGKKLKVTHGTFSKYLMDKDRDIRKQAFNSKRSVPICIRSRSLT